MKKLNFLIIAFLLLIPIVYSVTPQYFWPLNETSGTSEADLISKNNITIQNAASWEWLNMTDPFSTMYLRENVNTNNPQTVFTYPYTDIQDTTKSTTVSVWYNYNITGTDIIWSTRNNCGSLTGMFIVFSHDDDSLTLQSGHGSWSSCTSGANSFHGFNTWNLITVVHNLTENYIYINGTYLFQCSMPTITAANNFFIGDSCYQGGTMQKFKFSKLRIYNSSLTTTDINTIYTTDTSIPFTPQTVNFISPTVTNYSINNTQIPISFQCSVNGNLTLFFDTNANPKTNVKFLVNQTVLNYTTNVTGDGDYYFKGSCAVGINEVNTSIIEWIYDTTAPAFDLKSSMNILADNSTILNQKAANLTINFSILHPTSSIDSFFVNLTNSSMQSIFYYAKQIVSGGYQNYNYSNTTNIFNLPYGTYVLRLGATDTHTGKIINDYQVTKQKSKIFFKTQTGNNIKLETDANSNIDATKLYDRYSFTINFDDGLTTSRSIHVKSDLCPLIYINYSRYKAHFISDCGEFSGNWIDFQNLESSYTVFKYDDYHYRVDIASMPPTLTFNSIGGLNFNGKDILFQIGNFSAGIIDYSPIDLNPDITQGQTVNFSITGTGLPYTNTTFSYLVCNKN